MKRLFTLMAVLALLAVACVPMWGQNNSGGAVAGIKAVVPLVDPVGVSSANLISDCVDPAVATLLADNSYTLTLTQHSFLTVGAADAACIGDFYQTSLNGVPFNTTPNPFDYCPAGTDPWGCVTGTCTLLSEGRTRKCVAKGTYDVTIRDLGFIGHTAAEVAAENFCPAAFTDSFDSTPAPLECSCEAIQQRVIVFMPDESAFPNHGKYVSAAANFLDSIAVVSEECHSCIINQFARSVPQDSMKPCGDI